MKVVVCFILLMLSILSLTYGQNLQPNDQFSKRYAEVMNSVLTTDFQLAQSIADSLAKVANTDEKRLKSQLLLALLAENKADFSSSLKHASQADAIADAALNHGWKSKTSLFLATLYRKLGLLKFSSEYLQQAESVTALQEDPQMKALSGINILHERVFNNIELKAYHVANKYAQAAAALIKLELQNEPGTVLLKATNDFLLGFCNLHLMELNLADSFLNESYKKIEKLNTSLNPYIYHTMADLAIERDKLDEALYQLNRIEPYLKDENGKELKILVSDSWTNYYKKKGDLAAATVFQEKSIALKNQKIELTKQLLDTFVIKTNLVNNGYRTKFFFAIAGVILLLFLLAGIIVFLFKQREKHKEMELLAELEKPIQVVPSILPILKTAKNANVAVSKAKAISISKETEDRLYAIFVKHEENYFFLEKSINVKQLASSMGTNARYVSHIVQKFRAKSFYDYVQYKRVAYILEQLKNSPELLDFKLARLAEMAGFVSLSKFSTAFKIVTGMPPSAYVYLLKKENENLEV